MLLVRGDFSRAAGLTVEFVRKVFLPLALLFACSFFINHYLEDLARDLNSTDQGPWIAQIAEFLVSMIEGFALLLMGGYFLAARIEPMGWGAFLRRKLAPLTAESLRALTRVLLWTLAFIIPGLIVFFRLSFVPYIVVADPDYQRRPDAVARSMEITRPCWIRLTLFIAGLNVVDGLFELAPNLMHADDLISRLIFDLSGFLFSLFEFVLLYIIFENLRKSADAKGV